MQKDLCAFTHNQTKHLNCTYTNLTLEGVKVYVGNSAGLCFSPLLFCAISSMPWKTGEDGGATEQRGAFRLSLPTLFSLHSSLELQANPLLHALPGPRPAGSSGWVKAAGWASATIGGHEGVWEACVKPVCGAQLRPNEWTMLENTQLACTLHANQHAALAFALAGPEEHLTGWKRPPLLLLLLLPFSFFPPSPPLSQCPSVMLFLSSVFPVLPASMPSEVGKCGIPKCAPDRGRVSATVLGANVQTKTKNLLHRRGTTLSSLLAPSRAPV